MVSKSKDSSNGAKGLRLEYGTFVREVNAIENVNICGEGPLIPNGDDVDVDNNPQNHASILELID